MRARGRRPKGNVNEKTFHFFCIFLFWVGIGIYYSSMEMTHMRRSREEEKNMMENYVDTYRFDGTFQTENLFLEQVECARFASMAGKSRGTSRMNTVYPSVQFCLARSLETKKNKKKYRIYYIRKTPNSI